MVKQKFQLPLLQKPHVPQSQQRYLEFVAPLVGCGQNGVPREAVVILAEASAMAHTLELA